MKTEMALLLGTDGRPVMTLGELCPLLGINERTAKNQICSKSFPVPAFKSGSQWVAHVQDVASYIDRQRDEAQKEFDAR